MPDSAVFVECYIVSVFDNLSALLSDVEVDEAFLPLNVPKSIAYLEELANATFLPTLRQTLSKMLRDVDHCDTIAKDPRFVFGMLASILKVKMYSETERRVLFTDAVAIQVEQACTPSTQQWMIFFEFAAFWRREGYPYTLAEIFQEGAHISESLLAVIKAKLSALA
jgi:hypothetical protein